MESHFSGLLAFWNPAFQESGFLESSSSGIWRFPPLLTLSAKREGRRKLLVSPLVYLDPEPYARTVAQMTAHLGQDQIVNP